jgi:V8-like Glu-specific endopeptidase
MSNMSRAVTPLAVIFSVVGVFLLSQASRAQPVDEGVLYEEFHAVEASPPEFTKPYLGVVWITPRRVGLAGSKFLRLRFSGFELPVGLQFTIEVIAEDGSVLEVFDRNQWEGRTFVWSKVLPVAWVHVRVLAEAKPDAMRFRIDQMVYSLTVVAGQLSKVGKDNREDLYRVSDQSLLRAAAAVGKLSYLANGNRPRSCTGFLISDNLFVTNQHCLADQETCNTAVARFGYEKKSKSQTDLGKQFHCIHFIRACYNLDYALIELEGRPGDAFGHLETDTRALQPTDQLILIQHPGGKPKMVSRDKNCAVITTIGDGYAVNTDFGYGCDTEDGSSGSPVLLAQSMKVVGLHHLRAPESGVWKKQNRGVRMKPLAPELTPTLLSVNPLCDPNASSSSGE